MKFRRCATGAPDPIRATRCAPYPEPMRQQVDQACKAFVHVEVHAEYALDLRRDEPVQSAAEHPYAVPPLGPYHRRILNNMATTRSLADSPNRAPSGW